MSLLAEFVRAVAVLAPKQNRFAGTQNSLTVNLQKAGKVNFLLTTGNSTSGTGTGTTKVTVEACDKADASGSNTAIAFKYRKTATASKDDYGDFVDATAATGFTTDPGVNPNLNYLIEVQDRDLPAGKPYVRVKCVEQVADPVDGAIIALVGGIHQSTDQVVLP
jgi:hypothetical protein